MARYPKRLWQQYPTSTKSIAKAIAKAAVPDLEAATVQRGPYPNKKAAQIYVGEWYRFRETLRTDQKRNLEPLSYEGRLYALIENLVCTVEPTYHPTTHLPQWVVNFAFHPHALDYWRNDPEALAAAQLRHELFLVMDGKPTDDPDMITQRDNLLRRQNSFVEDVDNDA